MRLRRPIGLALVGGEHDRMLCVANRCGSLMLLDVAQRELAGEYDLGRRWSAICRIDDRRLLATDEEAHELVQFEIDSASRPREVRVVSRTPVSPYPVGVCYDAARHCAFVTSLWSRRVSRIDLQASTPVVTRVLDVELAPRELLVSPEGEQLIVADSFSGKLAVLDIADQGLSLVTVRTFPGHNIRGLAAGGNGKMLVVAHQMLNDLANTTRNDVHWGLLMSNDLRWLRLDSLLAPGKDLYAGAHMHPLGEAGNATADPAGLAMTPDGLAVVTLGGVGEVALGREADFSLYRIKVGTRPTAVVTSPNGELAFVANTLGDSVSILDLKQRTSLAEVSLGPTPPLTPAEQGELLFYDGSLSHDGWMSCHSCHTDGHTNGGLNDNFSDGSFGAPKKVLSLLGCAETGPYAWTGQVESLRKQVQNSVDQTMQRDRSIPDAQVDLIVAYLATLGPPPAVDRLRGQADAAAIKRGEQIFAERNCVACHAPGVYTTPQAYEVGLEDQRGNRAFNPPSLRGVGQRAPYFHDGRAERLEDVFAIHDHQLETSLTESELGDLLAFLRSL